MRRICVGLVTLVVLVGCTSESVTSTSVQRTVQGDPPAAATPTVAVGTTESAANDGLFPTVLDVTASTTDGSTWQFDVTLLSEYDAPERYADAWRVLDAADTELGSRVLTHDHAGEQPFTRSASIMVPPDITTVFIEGRDQRNGWSGERFELTLAK